MKTVKTISTFPTAKQRRKMTPIVINPDEVNLEDVAEHFVQSTILPAVLSSTSDYVSIPVPGKAYWDLDVFCDFCKQFIPRDYAVKISYDAGVMRNTLFVSW